MEASTRLTELRGTRSEGRSKDRTVSERTFRGTRKVSERTHGRLRDMRNECRVVDPIQGFQVTKNEERGECEERTLDS